MKEYKFNFYKADIFISTKTFACESVDDAYYLATNFMKQNGLDHFVQVISSNL